MKFIFPTIGKSVELTATHTGISVSKTGLSHINGHTAIEAEQAVKALVDEEKAALFTKDRYQEEVNAIGDLYKEHLEF